ncbi:hypothetical protein GDO86_012022 [Hymenochirus boettgeri]|uniref:Uncharacterized protein n=1 Tax=Hymenochirus boettgeri TaxID=247094 RepID=A0A8T2JGL4_9PIPI|nr:hypothetical protein GDO86_012022 [Hymenochirus boettgeri]
MLFTGEPTSAFNVAAASGLGRSCKMIVLLLMGEMRSLLLFFFCGKTKNVFCVYKIQNTHSVVQNTKSSFCVWAFFWYLQNIFVLELKYSFLSPLYNFL